MAEKKRTTTGARRAPARRTARAASAVLATEDDIRRRAYELFLARGGQPGRELQDWFQAEQELNGSEPES